MTEYSDEWYFDVDYGVIRDEDDCMDLVRDRYAEDFNYDNWVDNHYDSASDLWNQMRRNNFDADDVMDQADSDMCDEAWDMFRSESSHCDEDGEFECEGITFRRMNRVFIDF